MSDLLEADCGGANPILTLSSRLRDARAAGQTQNLGARVSSPTASSSSSALPLSERSSTFSSHRLLRGLRQVTGQEDDQAAAGDDWARDLALQLPPASVVAKPTPLTGAVPKQPRNKANSHPLVSYQSRVPQPLMFNASHSALRPSGILPLESRPVSAKWAADYLPKEVDHLPVVGDDGVVEEQAFESAEKTSEHWAQEFSELSDEALAEEAASARAAYSEEFWKSLEEDWEAMASADDVPSWLSYDDVYGGFHDPVDALASQYDFAEHNPTADSPNALEEGKKRLEEGEIPKAVLFFETACQQQPDSAEAWSLLGQTQSKNENDRAAIPALRKAATLLPSASPRSQEVLMSLAAAYANETYQGLACSTLQDWIYSNESYSKHLPQRARPNSSQTHTSSFMSQELHSTTTDLFLTAARTGESSMGQPDADVQCGLGILFNLSEDYDKAVDCFGAAVAANPNDAQLWNRLGASLANGDRSEEAISAYRQALQLSPGLVRSRYNLGVSCINLKAYMEACQHFVTALRFQAAARNGAGVASNPKGATAVSESIWASLRLSLSLLGRRDLLAAAEAKNVEEIAGRLGLGETS